MEAAFCSAAKVPVAAPAAVIPVIVTVVEFCTPTTLTNTGVTASAAQAATQPAWLFPERIVNGRPLMTLVLPVPSTLIVSRHWTVTLFPIFV